MTVQPKKHVFVITHENEDGEKFQGQFTTKKLSIMDRSKIGVRKSQLNGGMVAVRDENDQPTGQGIDESTDILNHMIAYMEVCLLQKPDWFKLDEIDDVELIEKVFKEVMAFETSFRRSKDGDSSGSTGSGETGQAAGNSESEKQNANSGVKKVVGKEIPTSLDA